MTIETLKTPPIEYNAEVLYGVPLELLRKATAYHTLHTLAPFEPYPDAQPGWLSVRVCMFGQARELVERLREFGPVVVAEQDVFTTLYFEPLKLKKEG